MAFLAELWLPILLSAVFVFIVSSLLHMVLPVHKGDVKKMPNEDAVLEAMRTGGTEPGEYMFPGCDSMEEMATPEMQEKLQRGPVGFMTVVPGFHMGKSLVQWFAYSLLVGVFVAYLTRFALAPGADYLAVFRVAGTIAVLGYAVGNLPNSIWKGVSWKITAKFVFDGVLYGLVTAGAFAWLWP